MKLAPYLRNSAENIFIITLLRFMYLYLIKSGE
jgi:hypothetical protein